MAAAIGWYGPLIDLSKTSSHVGDFVQLLVFVHRSQPIEKVIAFRTKPIMMTNIQVGDDTRPYFVVSVWHKYIGTMIVPGDIILLQNVKIVKFREVLQATTLQISSMTVLAHGGTLITSKDSDQLIAHMQLGSIVREKYSRVIYWILHTESAMQLIQKTDGRQNIVQVPKNWKSTEDQKPNHLLSITDVLCLKNSCKVVFHAFIGEIFSSSSWRYAEAQEHLSLRKALLKMDETRITEDLICVGCTKCGSPMDCRFPLYCSNNCSYVHDIGRIYRPFLLHVWDYTGLIPLLVKNRAAAILFGNITAEMVYKCYNERSMNPNPIPLHYNEFQSSNLVGFTGDGSRKPGSNLNAGNDGVKPNFFNIWLVLVKVLLKQQESPFQFEVNVEKEKDIENGRFELALLRMPCYMTERPFIK